MIRYFFACRCIMSFYYIKMFVANLLVIIFVSKDIY